MAIRVVRLGTARAPDEGLRLGTVRRPPRGVKKEDFARRNFYDSWLPELAPSAPLVSWALSEPWNDLRWETYAERYLAAPINIDSITAQRPTSNDTREPYMMVESTSRP